jgi:hypothetical protein
MSKTLKVIPLDHTARIHRKVRQLSKDLAEGAKHLTFVIETDDYWTVRSTRTDDADISRVLKQAAALVIRP